MQVSIETTSGLERKLTFGIPANDIDAEVEKRLKEAAKTVNIKGFRKGKVPLKIVKQRYGAGVRQEVIGDKINRSFYEAVQKQSVRPAGQPSIEPKQMEEGKDLEFVATFEVYPEVELADLGDVEIKIYEAEITDKDIDNMVKTLQSQGAEWEEIKRKSKKGERVNINFVGKIDGEEFEGGSANGHTLTLGSNTMIPGFEDGIVGMKTGEIQTIKVTFPDDYQVENLRGKDADFEITVNKVEAQKLPKLDDEFFAKFGVNEGGEEKFREEVKANMEREKQQAIKTATKKQVMDALLKNNKLDIPQALVKAEVKAIRNQMLQQYGQQAKNLDIEKLLPDTMFKDQAEKRVALGLIVAEVVKQENLKADKKLVRDLIEEAASTYEDSQEVINYYYSNEQLLSNIEAVALEQQVVDLVASKAKSKPSKSSYDDIIKLAAGAS